MQKIDFVIAWVDGNDVKHQYKRAQYQETEVAADAIADTRFASDDEIYFSIASILKYVPYCGKIYIVTDQQKPDFIEEFEKEGLCKPQQIKVIDHQILFTGFEKYLPTFNSLTIESMLWNIPKLSDYFIYLNDDFFFNAASEITDFLVEDKVKIYGHWQSNTLIKLKFNFRKWLNTCFGTPLQPKYTIAQMLSAELLGLKRYFEIHHRPHILHKHDFSNFFQENPELLTTQIQHRFRSAYQFLPVGLANHLKIQQQRALLEQDIAIAYLKNTSGTVQFLQNLSAIDIKFGCIQSLDQIEKQSAQQISLALKHKFADFLPSAIRL